MEFWVVRLPGLSKSYGSRFFLAVLCCLAFVGGNAMAQERGKYSDHVYYDAHRIPFSRYGSYLAIQHVHASARIAPPLDALFLRTTIMSTQTGWKKRL
jgi:hypothetical protein